MYYLEKLRKAREAKGLSQQALANQLGMEQSAYSKIETGKNQLNVSTLLHICEVLDIPVSEIINNYTPGKDPFAD
ncbi:MAG TPA: helix-turn-helix transcriptional regulator [Lacibacter sp.]|nr:helix-turn-helix transcriptional regulator [Lacibacter sp.]HMO90487.1 helix-turn-helix transcriptional regulator [Lacibacter sp.]HMP86809.1 helix-turn-helix transcriptional regulator [Lacibacter sp.]